MPYTRSRFFDVWPVVIKINAPNAPGLWPLHAVMVSERGREEGETERWRDSEKVGGLEIVLYMAESRRRASSMVTANHYSQPFFSDNHFLQKKEVLCNNERWGRTSNPTLNGHLQYPDDIARISTC